MAKGISSGIEKMVSNKQSQPDHHSQQLTTAWRDLRNKLDSILMVNNVMKSNEVRQKCLKLDAMLMAERITYISEQWGPLYVQKAEPLLHQLDTLERELAKIQPAS